MSEKDEKASKPYLRTAQMSAAHDSKHERCRPFIVNCHAHASTRLTIHMSTTPVRGRPGSVCDTVGCCRTHACFFRFANDLAAILVVGSLHARCAWAPQAGC